MMYKLIRRISSSFFSRPGQSLDEDTSTAPQIGQKRRLSTPEPDEPPSPIKRQKTDEDDASDAATDTEDCPPRPTQDTQDVKEVTKGVRDVELEDKVASESPIGGHDASTVPLPDSPALKASEVAQEVEEDRLEERSSSGEVAATEADEEDQKENMPPSEAVVMSEMVKEDIQQTTYAEVDDDEIPGLPSSADLAAAEARKVAEELVNAKREESTNVPVAQPTLIES